MTTETLYCFVCKERTIHRVEEKEFVCLVCEHKKQQHEDLKSCIARH